MDKEPVVDNSKPKTPEHPFYNIPEANYAPPNTKNFGAPAEKIPKDKEAAYRTVAPAMEKQLVDDVFQRVVTGSKVVLMIEELLNISPGFRERFRKESTPRRVSIKEMEKERKVAINAKIQIEEPFTSESKIEEVFIQEEHSEDIAKEIPNASNLANYIESTASKDVDAFGKEMEGYIIPDHYKTYLRSL